MPDESLLREKARDAVRTGSPYWPLHELESLVREKLQRGGLFVLQDVRYWASPAAGKRCLVCTQPIIQGNELEVRAPRGYVYAHVLCHRIWLEESNARRSSARSTGTSDAMSVSKK